MSDSKTPHLAFTEIMSAYQEKAVAFRNIPAIDHSEPRAGKASYEHRTSVVRPSVLDFICDTEIAARRSLTSAEYGYFCLYYKSSAVIVEAWRHRLLARARELVSREVPKSRRFD